MAYVPPWRRRQLEEAKPIDRKPRFLGDRLGGPDIEDNTGIRYSPRSPKAEPTTRILRMTHPGWSTYPEPPLVPTHDLMKLQPAFRKKVLQTLRSTRKLEKRKQKAKKEKKAKKHTTSRKRG